ncbi:hypothetical protein Gotur_004300 [Gossypium turneri]
MRFILLHQELSFLKVLLLFQYFCEDIEPPLKGDELSIPCRLVLNVVGIEETETLIVLKFALCVFGFVSSSKFNLLKVVLVFPISKDGLEAFFVTLLLIGVGATRSVAPSSFHLLGRLISCHCIVPGIVV